LRIFKTNPRHHFPNDIGSYLPNSCYYKNDGKLWFITQPPQVRERPGDLEIGNIVMGVEGVRVSVVIKESTSKSILCSIV
jgi:hypothetical protein